ncbi:arsenate reductase family protein [Planococcus salinarum]|uniref:arsenate reductase family protein n=1 Tax=Planococcus salinarum TaxID=622695 RepID=UPI000E3D6D5A|nr:arsenate reductase family protein [Planococcus salinarum]TAA71918.1 arsenate reductase family protein [Planococcus salinarum]
MMNFYWYPKCSTCQKAKKWLNANEVEFKEIHIVDNPPAKDELKAMVNASGIDLKKFFNTSGQRYRELQLKDKLAEMSEDEKLELLSSNGMLIKRPLAWDGAEATVGFKEETYKNTWS